MPYRKNARILAEIYLQHIAARRDFFFPSMRLTDAGPLMVTGAYVLLSMRRSLSEATKELTVLDTLPD
jgi:hypothetical protein